MTDETAPRWHRRGGGAALGMLAIVVLGVGLGFGRPDVALLGLPLAATAAIALRRPVGTASVAVGVHVEEDAVVAELRVDAPAGVDLVVLSTGAYEEPPTTVVVGPRRARSLVARLPVLHSGPQEVVRVAGRVVAAGGDLGQHLDPVVARAVVAPVRERVTSLLLPHRLTNRPGGHPARRLGDGLDFRDLAPFAPGDRLRRIDWRATARSPRPESDLIVRRMDATAEAAAVIVLDSRDDVGAAIAEWASDRPARKGTASLDLARPAVAAIAASYLEAGDRVAFHDLVRAGASARSGGGRRKLEQIRAVVTQTTPRPGGSVKAPVLPTAAVVYLVSTFLDEDVAGLAVLWRSAGHRVIAIDVLPRPIVEGADEEHRLAHRVLQLERTDRLDRLRRVDVVVVPWQAADRGPRRAPPPGRAFPGPPVSASTRPKVRARFELGPWVPGVVLPIAVGLVGILASLLVLQAALLAVGVVLSVVAAARVRTFVPWLLVALLVLGQLLRGPNRLDASLSGLVLALHLFVVLVLLARMVPVRSRLQLAALGPAAVTTGLIQVVAQVLVALLLASEDRLQAMPIASTIGGALLVLLAGVLILHRSTEHEG